jgi:hypothetical protein
MEGEFSRKVRPKRPIAVPDGFDVVCTIGRVTFGNGDRSPYVAAFDLIAEHGAMGSFSFPHEDGRTVTVEVTFE